MTARISYSPAQLAVLLGLPEPTSEQAGVIAAPLEPLAVIAGAGSGKSETMAARLVWLVANGMVMPERVLGLTFTRKAAAELGQRVRARLAGLRRAGLAVGGPQTAGPQTAGPQTAGPQTAGPQTAGPQTAGPQTAGPPAAGPQAAGPPAAGRKPAGTCWMASRSCPPTTPTPPGSSPTTRCARRLSRRCASSPRPWPGRSRPGWSPPTAGRWTRSTGPRNG